MFDVNVDRIFALDYPEVKKSTLYTFLIIKTNKFQKWLIWKFIVIEFVYPVATIDTCWAVGCIG